VEADVDVATALLDRLRDGWRRLVVPPEVREAEEAGPAAAVEVVHPPLAPHEDASEGLQEAEARLAALREEQRRIEARMRGMARLGGRDRDRDRDRDPGPGRSREEGA
jgi:hypothetical protein